MKSLFLFALPIIAGQVGQMLFGVGDIIVAGRYSNEVVSAIGVAGGIFAPFILVALGLCFAISPLASRYEGEKRPYPRLLTSAYLLTFVIATILIGFLAIVIFNIHWFGLLPEIEYLVVQYLWIVAPSLYGIVHFHVSKEFLQARGQTFLSNGLVLFFVLLNLPLNAIFMFGLLGCPELGIQGAALATLIGRTLMALMLHVSIRRNISYERALDFAEVKSILRLGLPISASTFFEVMVFSAVTLLIGRMDVLTSAAHNIVLTMASLTFMVPLGVSSAVSVRAGMAFGRKNLAELKEAAISSLVISLGFMSITALLYFTIPQILLRFATNDPELIAVASSLLFFAALFQLPDGAQITLLGVLRGMGITRLPMILTFICNWLVALPLGVLLAYRFEMEARGLWLGLALGLTGMSFALGIVLWRQIKKMALA
jgi:multidrug resistance protein, MATE family